MATAFFSTVEEVPPTALEDWVNGERESPACTEVVQLTSRITPAALRTVTRELSKGGGETSWVSGVNVERFLALVVALLTGPKPEVTCEAAAAFLATLRCLGNASPGLFHPLAFYELCKALPNVLCAGVSEAAAPPPRKKSRRKQQDSDDEDMEMEQAEGGPSAAASLPAQAADALAEQLCLFLEAVPLASHNDTLSQLVAALVEAASRGAGRRVFRPLTCCLGSEHGEPVSTARTVLRSLKPSLTLARETSQTAAAGSQAALDAQQACIDFLLTLCRNGLDCDEPRRAALQHAVQALLQHASVAAPERAESRAGVCSALCAVLAALPPAEALRYAAFLWRYSRTTKVAARMFSVEMAATVLQAAAATESPPRGPAQPDEDARASLGADGVPQLLWKLLVHRVSDKAPGVRAKSLGSLAVLLTKLHAEPGRRVLLQVQLPLPAVSPLMPPPEASGGGPAASPVPGAAGRAASPAVGSGRATPAAAPIEAAASLPTLGALLQQRCADERPAVRRAALQAMEAWARASGMQPSGAQLKLIARGCSDVSPAIRKQATRSLWSMLQLEPQSAALQAAWTSAILPLAGDTEPSVSDACLDTVLEGVLHPLARSKKPRDMAGWPLLLQLPASALPHLQKAIRVLARQKRLPSGLAPKLQALLADPLPPPAAAAGGSSPSDERPVVWSLLQEVADLPDAGTAQQKLDYAAVLRCWEQARGASGDGQAEEAVSALRMLVSLSGRSLLPAEVAAKLRTELGEQLQRFDASPQLAMLLVQACSSLASAAERPAWAAGLLKRCEARLAAAAVDQRQLRVCLIAMGELSLVAPEAVTPAVVAALQALAHGSGDGATPASCAAAYVALGKVCVSSAEHAQRLLPIFLKALTSDENAAVRSNALVVLFDLAKRHTALLERHFSTMALAIYDVAPVVRHKALMLFSQLLLEDYIKWRPTLFRAYCVALADSEAAVRAAANVCLFQLLLPRTPLLAFNSFTGLLFQINGYTSHPQHSASLLAAETAALEPLRGEGLAAQRRRLMVFRPLLGSMSTEHKLQTMAKLCHDVLGAVPEGLLPLEDTQGVLSDALLLLACKEIKLSSSADAAPAAADEADGDLSATAAAAAASARGKLLSQVARKATVEAIVPVVIELKRYLEGKHSPLLRDLFLFLRELLRDHKQYLQDILSRDKQLAAEIEYDMKQLDATRTRALQTVSPAAHASNARAPHTPAARANTPQPPGSKGKATAMRVPTADRLHALSVPRLRSQRKSDAGQALAAMQGTPARGAPSSLRSGRSGGASARGAASSATPAVDIVMASPR